MKIHPLLTLSGIVAVLAPPRVLAAPQEIPSPSSYPRLATSTMHTDYDVVPNAVDMQPTPVPELRKQLRRQASDSLGWNNPSTCNVGICRGYCTVFPGDGLRDETVTGVCCALGRLCEPRTVCVAYSRHSIATLEEGTESGGTVYCGTAYPYCYSVYWQYGYGLGTFLNLDCANVSIYSTVKNPSWALYASETNPAKGPMPITSPDSTETPSNSDNAAPSSTTLTPLPPSLIAKSNGKSNTLPVGALAGIVIGSIIAVALAVAAIIVIWFKLRKANLTPQVMPPYQPPYQPPFQPKESMSPAPVYTSGVPQSPVWPSPQQLPSRGY